MYQRSPSSSPRLSRHRPPESSQRIQNADQYRELGDRLLKRGNPCLAAQAYCRAADALIASALLSRVRSEVRFAPLQALVTLARIEQLVGASAEGRALLAQAYEALGSHEIASRFRMAGAISMIQVT